mmetsp:Transcript_11299/g.20427  ORF Transcript_11299/g.20427 Transcript_11299/m.20427 type:complete len:296 (+) Transcript_11299:85-972(+)
MDASPCPTIFTHISHFYYAFSDFMTSIYHNYLLYIHRNHLIYKRLRYPLRITEVPLGLSSIPLLIPPKIIHTCHHLQLQTNSNRLHLEDALMSVRHKMQELDEKKQNLEQNLIQIEMELLLSTQHIESLRTAIVKGSSVIHSALDNLLLRVSEHDRNLNALSTSVNYHQKSNVTASSNQFLSSFRNTKSSSKQNAQRSGEISASDLIEVTVGIDPERAIQQASRDASMLRYELQTACNNIRNLIREHWIEPDHYAPPLHSVTPYRNASSSPTADEDAVVVDVDWILYGNREKGDV